MAALRRAKGAIRERDFLIAVHERSEKALASHATALNDELGKAVTAVHELHSRCAAGPDCRRRVQCVAQARLQVPGANLEL